MSNKNSRPAGGKRTRPTRLKGPAARAQGAKAVKGLSRSGMSTNLKLTIGLVVFAVLAVGGIFLAANAGDEPAGATGASDERLVRPDSHKLSTAADGKATLVEFLDFECEACGALYPSMEKLLEEYDGKVTFVIRYFPIRSHVNAELAARVVESAAAQGKFAEMYRKMYDNQTTWGEKQTSQEQLFLGFAEEIGVDMEAFKAKLADPATAERVAKDVQDGNDLGVSGTPTIFFNGERVERPTYESLKQAIDAALAG